MGKWSVQLFFFLRVLVKIWCDVAAWKVILVVTAQAAVTEKKGMPVPLLEPNKCFSSISYSLIQAHIFVKSGFMIVSSSLQDSFPSTQTLRERKKIFCLDYSCMICFLNSSDKCLMNVQATENEMHVSSPKRNTIKCFSKLIGVSRLFSTFPIFWKNSRCSQATYPSLFLRELMSFLKSMSALTVFWGCVFYFSCSCSQSGMIPNLREFVYDSVFSSLGLTKLPCPLNLKVLDEWTLHPLWFLLHWLPCTLGVQSFVLLLENKNPRLQVFSHTFLPASLFTQGFLVILSLEFRSCWFCGLS